MEKDLTRALPHKLRIKRTTRLFAGRLVTAVNWWRRPSGTLSVLVEAPTDHRGGWMHEDRRDYYAHEVEAALVKVSAGVYRIGLWQLRDAYDGTPYPGRGHGRWIATHTADTSKVLAFATMARAKEYLVARINPMTGDLSAGDLSAL